MTTCSACGTELEPAIPGLDHPVHQFDNALHLAFDGGYGEFVDAPVVRTLEGPDALTAVLCHDCAHQLCEAHPWIAAIIDPARSHTHRQI